MKKSQWIKVIRCGECKHRGTDDCPFHIKGGGGNLRMRNCCDYLIMIIVHMAKVGELSE